MKFIFHSLAILFALVLATSNSIAGTNSLQKRWLFVWRNMSDPNEVDRMISRFPQAAAAGYNGVAFSYNIAAAKATELTNAAKQNHLDLIAIVMGNPKDRNYVEGVLAQDELFVVHNGRATHQPDNPTRVLNADFEDATGNHFKGWSFQDDEGVTTFADHDVVHDGKASLRMQTPAKTRPTIAASRSRSNCNHIVNILSHSGLKRRISRPLTPK